MDAHSLIDAFRVDGKVAPAYASPSMRSKLVRSTSTFFWFLATHER